MTIKDVARIAGVSQSAVSRFLNGGSLSQEKRERIQETIDKTGYKPTVAARMMRTGRQHQIGVLIPRVYSDSVAQIVTGINEYIQDYGYGMVIGETRYEEERELEYLALMEESGAAGIVVMGTELSTRRLAAYRGIRVPLVVMGQNITGIPCVFHNDFCALEELTGRVLKKWHSRFAYIGVDDRDPQTGTARREGMLSACRRAGYKKEDILIEYSDFTAMGGYNAIQRILKTTKDIEGVVCATDTIAFGAMRALYEAGRVPGSKVGIAGVGGSQMAAYSLVPLTTAHYYFKKCGMEAAEILIKTIEAKMVGELLPAKQVCLDYKIVERASI